MPRAQRGACELCWRNLRRLLGFAGIEMHRRILGLAHVAEFDRIEDPDLRAPLEARSLKLGRDLVLERNPI
jgi:5-methylthioribose kinase